MKKILIVLFSLGSATYAGHMIWNSTNNAMLVSSDQGHKKPVAPGSSIYIGHEANFSSPADGISIQATISGKETHIRLSKSPSNEGYSSSGEDIKVEVYKKNLVYGSSTNYSLLFFPTTSQALNVTSSLTRPVKAVDANFSAEN
jgi:hypothetical protein